MMKQKIKACETSKIESADGKDIIGYKVRLYDNRTFLYAYSTASQDIEEITSQQFYLQGAHAISIENLPVPIGKRLLTDAYASAQEKDAEEFILIDRVSELSLMAIKFANLYDLGIKITVDCKLPQEYLKQCQIIYEKLHEFYPKMEIIPFSQRGQARNQGWDIIAEYKDGKISPQMQKALAECNFLATATI